MSVPRAEARDIGGTRVVALDAKVWHAFASYSPSKLELRRISHGTLAAVTELLMDRLRFVMEGQVYVLAPLRSCGDDGDRIRLDAAGSRRILRRFANSPEGRQRLQLGTGAARETDNRRKPRGRASEMGISDRDLEELLAPPRALFKVSTPRTNVPHCETSAASVETSENSTEIHWIGIRLQDQRRAPIPHEPYILILPNGNAIEGRTDENGYFEHTGPDPGTCEIQFPELHPVDVWESGSTGAMHDYTRPLPIVRAQWERRGVMPEHVVPPSQTPPGNSKVKLLVDVENIPDGTEASIEMYATRRNTIITMEKLIVQGNKVVSAETGEPPHMAFSLDHGIWNPWDDWEYHFTVSIDYRKTTATTPTPLVLKRHFVFVSDAELDNNDDGYGTGAICEIASSIVNEAGLPAIATSHYAMDNAKVEAYPPSFASALTLTMHGSYAWFLMTHGAFDPNPKVGFYIRRGPQSWNFRLDLGAHRDHFPNAFQAPKYLVFFCVCLVGKDPLLARVFLNQGTRNVIGFQTLIMQGHALNFAKTFYQEWVGEHHANPEKIPECFIKAAQKSPPQMQPRLYGNGSP